MAQSSGSSDNDDYVGGRRKKRWTDQLMASGMSTAPVGHPIEVLTRPLTAALGGYFEREEEKAEAQSANAAITAALSLPIFGGGASGVPMSTTTTPVGSTADADPGVTSPTGVPDAGPRTPVFSAIEGASPNTKIANIITGAAEKYGVDPNYMMQTAARESSFNPNAQAGTSSAKGLFQFTNGTAQAYGLRDPFNPVANADAAARLAQDNAKVLASAGHEATPPNLYAAHFLGSAGATRFLNGLRNNPNAPAASYVQESQARANRPIFYNRDGTPKTAGQVHADFSSKYGGGGTAVAQADTRAPGGQPVQAQFVIPPGSQSAPGVTEMQATTGNVGGQRNIAAAVRVLSNPNLPAAVRQTLTPLLVQQMKPQEPRDNWVREREANGRELLINTKDNNVKVLSEGRKTEQRIHFGANGEVLSVDASAETPKLNVLRAAPQGKNGQFEGTSAEVQAMNRLVSSGKMTMDEAAEVMGGKVVTNPADGSMTFIPASSLVGRGGTAAIGGPQTTAPQPGAPSVLSPGLVGGAVALTPPKSKDETPNEIQGKARGFAQRMYESGPIIDRNEKAGLSATDRNVDQMLPEFVGRYLKSDEFKSLKQAEANFITALLRRESGASINDPEFIRDVAKYMPMPSDPDTVLEQKRQARQSAIQGMIAEAGTEGGKPWQPRQQEGEWFEPQPGVRIRKVR